MAYDSEEEKIVNFVRKWGRNKMRERIRMRK